MMWPTPTPDPSPQGGGVKLKNQPIIQPLPLVGRGWGGGEQK